MQYKCDYILQIFNYSAFAAIFLFSLKQSLYSISRAYSSACIRSACLKFKTILQFDRTQMNLDQCMYIDINQNKWLLHTYINIIIIKSMPKQLTKPQSQQQLEVALRSLYQSAKIIYANFQFVFHILGLMVLAYLAFKLGKWSVKEDIAYRSKAIEKRIKDVEKEKQGLPSRIRSVNSFYFKLIMLLIVLGLTAGGVLYHQQIAFDIKYAGVLLAVCIVFYIAKLIHISSLTAKSKKLPEKQKQIMNIVKQIDKALGPKVQNSLKNILCHEKIKSKQQVPSHICTKNQCKEIRDALRAKYELIKNLAECALQFQWCSVCKARKPFDELVKFEAKAMPAVRDDISEDQDADVKIGYLMETLEEIDKWVQEAGPCNCSKLYMEVISKNRKGTNRQLKQINARIELHERKKQTSSVFAEQKMIDKQNPKIQVNGSLIKNKRQ